MALLQGFIPPTYENWRTLVHYWQWGYPIIGSAQWIVSWYGMGKTSVASRFNIPGRIAWITMESPGFLTLLYVMTTLPAQVGITELPWQNKLLAGLFVTHYSYRAITFPFLQPSMSPVHPLVWLLAFGFQVANATSLGGWLAAYGPVTPSAWASTEPGAGGWTTARVALGAAVWALGLAGNYWHDEQLREIRRAEMRRQERAARELAEKDQGNGHANGSAAAKKSRPRVDKHYQVPEAGLFRYMLYPHYLCEWIEWAGFWLACGWDCAPARAFFLNEFFTMLPRAVRGKWWYLERFGAEKIGKRWAVLPGIY